MVKSKRYIAASQPPWKRTSCSREVYLDEISKFFAALQSPVTKAELDRVYQAAFDEFPTLDLNVALKKLSKKP